MTTSEGINTTIPSPFLTNKYTTWYLRLMSQAVTRIKPKGYVEKHHLIPRSLGGTDNQDNLRLLTAREHYVAHLLLTKMVTGKARRGMALALSMFNTGCRNLEARQRPSGRLYAYSRQLLQTCMQGQRPSEAAERAKVKALKGKPLSATHREKLGKALSRPIAMWACSPDNVRYVVDDLVAFCQQHGISPYRPYRLALIGQRTQKPQVIVRGQHKGWLFHPDINLIISNAEVDKIRQQAFDTLFETQQTKAKTRWPPIPCISISPKLEVKLESDIYDFFKRFNLKPARVSQHVRRLKQGKLGSKLNADMKGWILIFNQDLTNALIHRNTILSNT